MATEEYVAVMVLSNPVIPDLAVRRGRPGAVVPGERGRDGPEGWAYYQRSIRWEVPPLVAGEPLWELLASVAPFATRIAGWLRGADIGMRDPDVLLTGGRQGRRRRVARASGGRDRGDAGGRSQGRRGRAVGGDHESGRG